MGSFSLPHILVLAVIAILLLGGGRFSAMMGDVAKGVKQFKKGMADEDEDDGIRRPKAQIEAKPAGQTVERSYEAERARDDR